MHAFLRSGVEGDATLVTAEHSLDQIRSGNLKELRRLLGRENSLDWLDGDERSVTDERQCPGNRLACGSRDLDRGLTTIDADFDSRSGLVDELGDEPERLELLFGGGDAVVVDPNPII